MKIAKFTLHILLVIIPTILYGCKDDDFAADGLLSDYGNDYFIIESQSGNDSRITHNGIYNTTFDDDDRVGIFGLDNDKELYNLDYSNVEYYVTSVVNLNNSQQGNAKALRPVNETSAIERGLPYYLIYYPYDPDMTLEKAKSLSCTVEIDQNSAEAFTRSDFLWDIVSPDIDSNGNRRKYVNVVMDHIMASIIVMIPFKDVTESTRVTILNQPVSLTDADITNDISTLTYSVDETTDKHNLTAWDSRRNDIYVYYRTAVPACRNLLPGTELLKIRLNDDSAEKTYRLKKKDPEADDDAPVNIMSLFPGRNYIFSIAGKIDPPSIEVDDDDSWVLDVIDPTTGKQVGLLCREYLYWSPIDTKYNNTPSKTKEELINEDQVYDSKETFFTGPCDIYYSDRDAGADQYVINSQAWVFYPMIKNLSGASVPDLRKGTVLKFMYDIQSAGGNTFYFYRQDYQWGEQWQNLKGTALFPKWPYPHVSSGNTYGFFRVRHGHEWIGNNPTNPTAGEYGIESDYNIEYYMHGIDITWDYDKNRISGCTPYSVHTADQQPGGRYGFPITTEIAYNRGHIATDKNGNAFVSYSELESPIQDVDGNTVCQTVIHYLTDVRQGQTVRYPIVKIGANTFWMSRDLRATVLNDGTPIKFVEPKNEDGVFKVVPDETEIEYIGPNQYNMSPVWTKPSYTYNGGKMSKVEIIENIFFDPFNDEYVSSKVKNSRVPFQYNYAACTNSKLAPIDGVNGEQYSIIKVDDMIMLMNYIGDNFAGKLMANRNFTRHYDDYADYEPDGENLAIKDQMLDGYWAIQDWYMANISGLNLSAPGTYTYHSGGNIPHLVSSGFGSEVSLYLGFDENDPIGHDKYNNTRLGLFNGYTYSLYTNQEMLNYGSNGLSQLWDKYDEFPSVSWRWFYMAPVRCLFHFDLPENIYHFTAGANTLSLGSRSITPYSPVEKKVYRNYNIRLELEEM